VNANLLRKWVVGHQLAVGALTKPAPNRMDAFIPVVLGNGGAGANAQVKRACQKFCVKEVIR